MATFTRIKQCFVCKHHTMLITVDGKRGQCGHCGHSFGRHSGEFLRPQLLALVLCPTCHEEVTIGWKDGKDHCKCNPEVFTQ